jgi:excisionase family DNA binding protein
MSAEMNTTNERPLLRGIRATAEITGLSASFIRRAIDEGDLRATRIGRRVLVKDADLLDWINRNDDPREDHQEAA